MKAVGDYIHSLGLKFGIYSSAGTLTCQERAASLDHEEVDALDWASWGVDYLKYDNCFNEGREDKLRYERMRDALNATGRPIFYSICNWGMGRVPLWGNMTGNSWRTTVDITNFWDSMKLNILWNSLHPQSSGPGGWNDPDMLEVGVTAGIGMSLEEEKTHFALWCFVKAPLIIGADLSTIKEESLAILKSEHLIKLNQDSLGVQAQCVLECQHGFGTEVWQSY
mmetsp:Transcript_3634/g.2691  ORF Transcript_3634/g.2691 Transcript_3634/m.2691 type:complete len:224 (+) Transcript_3634:281-952(+)